jgi:capsular exopolysaccharide synthesis family protein
MSRYRKLLEQLESRAAPTESISEATPVSKPSPTTGASPFTWTTPPATSPSGRVSSPDVLKLVRTLLTMPDLQSARMLAFCAVETGNGCTWVCSRTAETLAAQISGTVCLVDCNLRSPSLHEVFGIANHSNGLSDAVGRPGRARELVTRVSENLGIISSGSPASGLTLTKVAAVRAALEELRSIFDYVLLDLPAVNTGIDAIQLAQLSDGTILVVEAHSTNRNAAQAAELALRNAGVRLLGAVLNRRTFPIPNYLYKRM